MSESQFCEEWGCQFRATHEARCARHAFGIWNPVDLVGRPKCFHGMHRPDSCPATATRYWHDPQRSIFLFLCDDHATEHETLPIAVAMRDAEVGEG